MVARVVWDHEAAGSSPVTSTIYFLKSLIIRDFKNIQYNVARVAQLIERCLAKAKVAGLSPVSRSMYWRHSQVVRHESAKLWSPVQIRVSPPIKSWKSQFFLLKKLELHYFSSFYFLLIFILLQYLLFFLEHKFPLLFLFHQYISLYYLNF